MTVPALCRECGDRIDNVRFEVCSKPVCIESHRRKRIAATGKTVQEMVTKEYVFSLIDGDLAYGSVYSDKTKQKLVELRAKVKAHPWADCSIFLAARKTIHAGEVTLREPRKEDFVVDTMGHQPNVHPPKQCSHGIPWGTDCDDCIEAFKTALAGKHNYARKDAEVTTEAFLKREFGYDPGHDCYNLRRFAELFKDDLRRAALSYPVSELESVEGVVVGCHVRPPNAQPNRRTVQLTIEVDLEAGTALPQFTRNPSSVIVVPKVADADYYAVPKRQEKTIEQLLAQARATGKWTKDLVKVAVGCDLECAGAKFGLFRNPGTHYHNGVGLMAAETDDAYRARLLHLMPAERGETFYNRSHFAGGLNPSNGCITCSDAVTNRIAGKFDAASGEHLTVVARLNGVYRKPGEIDESLRIRLYKMTDD